MAYDEGLAARIRDVIAPLGGAAELKMMGGLCFMRGGNMACGVIGEALMVRLGQEGAAEALRQDGVAPMEIGGGRRPRAFVTVSPEITASDAVLAEWVGRGVAFADSLPPKPQRRK